MCWSYVNERNCKKTWMITANNRLHKKKCNILDWKNFINIKNSAKKIKNNSTIHNDTK